MYYDSNVIYITFIYNFYGAGGFEAMDGLVKMLTDILNPVNSFVWGPVMLILLLGTGLYLTLGLRFLTFMRIPQGFKKLWAGRNTRSDVDGELSPFHALMTALAATVGTGNIAGVATAIFVGGPGALFWMWCTAMLGMATKFAEALLAVRYREITPEGNVVGGPMYYIKNGLGPKWAWLGTLFAVFGAIAGFGIGNMTQTNSIAQVAQANFGVSPTITAGILVVFVGMVLIGGVQRIGAVAGKIVPVMACFYIAASLLVIILKIDVIPQVFTTIIHEAFSPSAAFGASIWMTIRYGVARGVFSNEAGLGSAPIAHATATVRDPVNQALVGMLGTFIDTIIICSMTGFAILASGVLDPTNGVNGAALTTAAFNSVLNGVLPAGFGGILVTVALCLFAYTTILGWCVYSERCMIYLFGDKVLKPFRVVFTLVVPIGAIAKLEFVWLLSDTFNALMAIPNLIGLLLLSPVVFTLTKEYIEKEKQAQLNK